jgi:K+ transporter
VNGDTQPEGSSTATASGRVYGLVSRRRWALALVRSIKYAWMCACYYSCSVSVSISLGQGQLLSVAELVNFDG